MVDSTVKQILGECVNSTRLTAQILFPERFSRPFASIHKELFNLIDNKEEKQIVIAAPRGFGKTSIMNLALPAKNLLFREKKFIVPVSCSSTSAIMQSENLKSELRSNVMIKKLFGDVKPSSKETPFSQDMWGTDWGSVVFPRGRGQQVRGLLFENSRPDLILVDDLEDSEEVRSEEQRAKVKGWFFSDLCNSIDRAKKDWKIIFMGTVLHEDSLLQNLLDHPSWTSIRLELCDDNYHSNWSDFMDDSEVKKLVNSFREAGLLDVFYREYRNLPVATEDSAFQSAYFKYFDEADLRGHKIENIILADPAKTVKMHSDESAIVGVGIDNTSGAIYVRDLVHAKLHPDEFYSNLFDMAKRLNALVIGVEVTSLNEFITYPIKDAMIRNRQFFELVELKARGKKEDRIRSLVPFYRRGLIYHNPNVCGALEAQLLSFPSSKLWDCMDALAYVVEMMDIGGRYADIVPTNENIEDEYKELEEEDYAMTAMAPWRVL